MMERRGITARILETGDAPVSVYGELTTPGATRTLLFYAHFDGQPIGPPEAWATPPFEPTLRSGRLEDNAAIIPWQNARYPLADDARIYARSASDDKAPIVAMLAAIDALRAREHSALGQHQVLPRRRRGGRLAQSRAHARNRIATLLASDLWIFGDGPIDPRGLPRVVLGVRGVVSFRITVYGAASSLHSGHYGNVAPNPGARLAHLIASMRAPDGTILVDGLDADPPSREALALARDGFDSEGMLRRPADRRSGKRPELRRIHAAPGAQRDAALAMAAPARNATRSIQKPPPASTCV